MKKMITRSQFYQFALEANEGQANVRDDVLPVPTLDERVSLYLQAVHGNRDFTDQERSNARDILLDSMAAESNQGCTDRKAPHQHSRPDRDVGTVLNRNGWNVGISLDVSPHGG